MRRLHALLIAGLMAAPLSAIAGPDTNTDKNTDPNSDEQTQTFEWSSVTGRARLGVMVMGLTPELREHFGAAKDTGVMIAKVEPKSAAAAAGLQVGDILTDVKGESVDSAGDVLNALSDAKKNENVALVVIRDRKPLTLSAKMQNDPGPRMQMGEPRWPDWVQEFFDSGPNWTPHRDHDVKGRNKT